MKTIELKIDGKVVPVSTETKEAILNTQKPADMPNVGDVYFYISGSSDIYEDIWRNTIVDIERYKKGNCFFNMPDAEQELARKQKVTAIKRRIAELNEGWKPNFDDKEQQKYRLLFGNITKSVIVDYDYTKKIVPEWQYFENLSIGFQLIDEFGDDLHYLFM